MSIVYGTKEGVRVENKPDRRVKDYKVVPSSARCVWCERIFEDDERVICAVYETEDGSTDWGGSYIHGNCDYDRHDATLEIIK